ncbi:MAG TPA: protein-methionine-sulfoxide reductase catalytic subunit MsrP [Terriglobia bacterium]|nr:protein-methionine-sulfoxide reductase catalytic subunit MsrP [Terriglobia bacterium]
MKKASDIAPSEITPKSVYINRRKFLLGASAAAAGLLAADSVARMRAPSVKAEAAEKFTGLVKSPFSTTEAITPMQDVTHYNNFYEFGTDKLDPSKNAWKLKTSPWFVKVDGHAANRKTYDLDSLMRLAPLEELIYRHRCVEAWSIVVPWIGFPLNVLIKQAQPDSKAKYVAFQSLYDSKEMTEGRYAGIAFPYVEGLRMDEAMHPLTILCFGMYGQALPNQDGAPVRIVIPWKYGFKSIKSIVKVSFVEKQPPTTWNLENSHEYGFYSNVNPHVDHPRWSQAKERRLGEFFRRPTLMFNGYGGQVAQLYTGMDLRKYF